MANTSVVEKKLIDILLKNNILHFRFEPPFVFTTGLKSPIYIDNRMLISYPKERQYATSELVKLIKEKIGLDKFDYISSTLTWAAPFGTMVAEGLNVPFILIRERHRPFGKQNKIEGLLPKGKKVLLVEDHVSTAANIVDNVKAVREAGGKVEFCVALSEFELDQADKSLKDLNLQLFTLARGKQMVKEALNRKLISSTEKKEIDEWFANPVNWGEVRGYYAVD